MKLKAVVIVSLLVLILTVGAASAANDTLSTDASIDDATSEKLTLEENSNSYISNEELILEENSNSGCSTSSQMDEVKASSSQKNTLSADDGTFTTLQNKINEATENSTITLENDYDYDSGFDTEGINISKSLTIDGNGFTINGNGESRIFHISRNVEVTLKNLNLQNGSNMQGGAIYNRGTLILANSTLEHNSADISGGAIYNLQKNTSNSFIIMGNTFTNNVAGQLGGAIYDYEWNSMGPTTITDNNFTDNVAEDGSAVYVECPEIYVQDMGVPDNEFNNNNYTFNTWVVGTEINVTGNTFKDIQDAVDAAKDGYIIYLDGITYVDNGGITIDKSLTFIGQENTLLDSNDINSNIYIGQDAFDVTFKDINFTHYAGINSTGFNLNIINCTFDNITPTYTVYINNPDSNITFINSTFSNNQLIKIQKDESYWVSYAVWIIYSVANDKLVVDGCSFINNYCIEINGYAIWCERTNDVIITNTTFKKNRLFELIVPFCRNFTLADSTFDDNLGWAGFISVNNQHRILPEYNYIYFDAEVNISNCNFIRNNISNRGISLYQDHDGKNYVFDAIIENCIFESNTNNLIYYHIYDHLNSNKILKNCTFINNSGYQSAFNFVLGSPYIVDCVFENNSETCINGTGPSDSGEFNALNCSFKNNQAECIKISYFNTANVLDCVFENNSGEGLNISSVRGNVTILNCNFTNNSDGGIKIRNYGSESTVIRNCSFVNNSAFEGGAINMVSNNTLLTDCIFENNTADYYGGAIFVDCYSYNATIKNCSFIKNYGMHDYDSNLELKNSIITNCTFENHYAVDGSDGSLIVHGENNTITNCSFKNNVEGGLYFNSNNSVLSNCIFENNSCIDHPVFGVSGENILLANCSFINNHNYPGPMEDPGPALGFSSLNGTIINCTFVNNSGIERGGAIRISYVINNTSNVNIIDCSFVNNSVVSADYERYGAGAKGAAIFIYQHRRYDYPINCSIINCSFVNNYIDDEHSGGGAIASENDYCNIINCSFEYNSCVGGIIRKNSDGFNSYTYPIGGSAIYICPNFDNADVNIINSTFKSNKINSSLSLSDEDSTLTLNLKTLESYINAIYCNGRGLDTLTINMNNVTYWDNGEELNTGELTPIMDSLQTSQELTLEIYDSNGDLFLNMTQPVDDDGNLVYNYIDLPDGNYTYIAYHLDNDYYGYAVVEGNFSVNSTFSVLNDKIRIATDNTTLKKDYAFDLENDTDFTDGIVIDKNITIYGEGHIIDANNLARIFNVTEGASLTLVNVTLINGNADNGGAIYNNGTLVVIDSLLEGNNATEGGAIYSRDELTIINSTVVNNHGKWGIIDALGNTTIVNLTFENNSGEWGGIYNYFGNMTITDSNLTSNYGSVTGSAVYNYKGDVTITDSNIKYNEVPQEGVVWTYYGEGIHLNDVIFVDNTVDSLYSYDGVEIDTTGATFLKGVAFEIENISDFMNGSPITINVSETKLGEEFNGYVTIAIGEEKFSVELVNGTGSATIIPNLEPGTYAAGLTFYQTDKYDLASATSNNFTVTPKMVPTTISYQALTSVPGGDNYLIAVLKDNEGNPLKDKTITLTGDVEAIGTTNSNGKAIFDLSDLKPGDYSIVISYAGEEGLYPTSETVELTIPKVNTKMDVSLVDGVLTAILTEDGSPLANKNISVKVNGSDLSNLTDGNGKAVFDLTSLGLGSDDVITVTYTDDDGFSLTESVKVVEKINEIEVPINATINLTYSDGKAIATLTDLDGNPLANKNLAVSINGTPLLGAKTDSKGVYTIDASGNATVVVSYYSEGTSITSTLSINEMETIVNNTVYVNNTVEVEKIVYVNNTVEVPVEVEKIVYVNNTVEVPVEVEKIVYVNNTVEVPVEVEKIVYVNSTTDLPIDTEKIVYINQTVEVPVEVEKIVYVNDTTEIPVELEKIVYLNNTVEVPVYINRTIEINNTVYVTPNRTKTIIEYNNMVTTAVAKADGRVGEYFYVRLTDDKGKALANKPIKIGFNGVVYNRTTDSDGRAKLQINLGYKGIYTFAIGFLGDDEYTGAFEVASITVNLQKPQLTTASKTYKASAKTKSLTATLKTVNGNPVSGKKISFTVNGKTYAGTTNAKGVATVKVSLSKKGTYSFTVKYAGDTQFATVSKKAKLTIK